MISKAVRVVAVCTFFGHREVLDDIEIVLESTVEDLIKNKNVTTFYVGNQGGFDFTVSKVLKKLKLKYPHIICRIALAYMPQKNVEYNLQTVVFDGAETVLPKYAIDKRNRWMIKHSQYVACYAKYTFGGAAKYKKVAEKQNKTVINIMDI